MPRQFFIAILSAFFFVSQLIAQENVAIVTKDGLLVFVPGIGGPETYGTYSVPIALGRESLDRFQYLGNPLQINFLPPSELPSNFHEMNKEEKLEQFFRTESLHMTKSFGKEIEFANFKLVNIDGVDCLYGSAVLDEADPEKMELRIIARVAGEGILHAAYQNLNPATTSQTQSMAEQLLGSFKFVPRQLTPKELEEISIKTRE